MKKLTQFSVNYPVTILMVVLGIMILGWISYDKLGVDLFPDLNNPRIFVEIKSGERPPEEMEKQFVENIEDTKRRKNVIDFLESINDDADLLILNGDIFDLWYISKALRENFVLPFKMPTYSEKEFKNELQVFLPKKYYGCLGG